MPNTHAEHYQTESNQDIARQRLSASRQDFLLYAHLFQASLVVERDNPLWRTVAAHRNFVRNLMIALVILLSITIGLLSPQIVRLLGM